MKQAHSTITRSMRAASRFGADSSELRPCGAGMTRGTMPSNNGNATTRRRYDPSDTMTDSDRRLNVLSWENTDCWRTLGSSAGTGCAGAAVTDVGRKYRDSRNRAAVRLAPAGVLSIRKASAQPRGHFRRRR